MPEAHDAPLLGRVRCGQYLFHSVPAQGSCMFRFGRQSPECIVDKAGVKCRDLGTCFPAHPIGEGGPRSNGCGATAHLVAHVGRYLIDPQNGKAQDIAACRIRHFYGYRRRSQLADVPGILKVLEKPFRIHGCFIMAPQGS